VGVHQANADRSGQGGEAVAHALPPITMGEYLKGFSHQQASREWSLFLEKPLPVGLAAATCRSRSASTHRLARTQHVLDSQR
jgi:hypothetical protein